MASTADNDFKEGTGTTTNHPVAVANLFKGEMVSLTLGFLNSLVRGDKFMGHLVAGVDNSGGAAGDLKGEVKTGKYLLEVDFDSTYISVFMVRAYVYAVDDNTYTCFPTGTPVGRIIQRTTTSRAIVEFDTNISRFSMVGGMFEDFFRLSLDNWTFTEVNTGSTGIVLDANHGLRLVTDTADNDGPGMQLLGETIQLADNQPFIMGARIEIDEVVQSDILIGAAITDTTLLGGLSDGVYFRSVDATTDINLVIEKDSVETELVQAGVLVAATVMDIGVIYDGNTTGSTFHVSVNGVVGTAQVDTNRPDNEWITPSIEFLAGEAAAKELKVSHFDAYQPRI